MSGVDLGKQVGPLPLGAWLAVVATGLGIAVYTRHNSVGSEPVVVEDTSGVPGVGDGSTGQWVDTNPPAQNGTPAVVDNETWGRNSVNYLIAQGYDPAVSDSAIRKYLAAVKLSVQEYALVRLALTHLGSPPVPLPPGPDPTKPPVVVPGPHKPPPKPPHLTPVRAPHGFWTVVITSTRGGQSPYDLARKYYGHATMWGVIYNANRIGVRRADGTPGWLHVPPNMIHDADKGRHLIIPKFS